MHFRYCTSYTYIGKGRYSISKNLLMIKQSVREEQWPRNTSSCLLCLDNAPNEKTSPVVLLVTVAHMYISK